MKLHPTPLRCVVMDVKGPLEAGSFDKAKVFAHDFVTSLNRQ